MLGWTPACGEGGGGRGRISSSSQSSRQGQEADLLGKEVWAESLYLGLEEQDSNHGKVGGQAGALNRVSRS